MHIYRDLTTLPAAAQRSVIAIGNFDGVHRGHQQLIAAGLAAAKREKTRLSIMSFVPHPREYFGAMKGRSLPLALTPLHHKLRLLKHYGVEQCFLLRFNAKLAHLPAEAFIEEMLMQQCKARKIITGDNFIFGHNRGGDAAMLQAYADRGAFLYKAIAPVSDAQNNPYSSTRARMALANADMVEARVVLGHAYSIMGRVQRGEQRGRTLGFPTANIALHHLHLPAYGVYAVRYRLCDDASIRDIWHDGIANLGIRPTVARDNAPANLEVHGLNESRDLYGKRLEVAFVQSIRGEQKFADIDALKAQITLDVAAARSILQANI